MKAATPTYQEWLAIHGYDSCTGCVYNIAQHARCVYPGPYCVEYVLELKRMRERARETEPELWEEDESHYRKKC